MRGHQKEKKGERVKSLVYFSIVAFVVNQKE